MATGNNIRRYREAIGWTLDDLAERAGLAPEQRGTISALENRDSKRSEFFGKLAAAFRLSLDELADVETDFTMEIRRRLGHSNWTMPQATWGGSDDDAQPSGRARLPCSGYVIDHVRPLCAGGADDPSNMQWQTIAEGKAKDKIERRQCKSIQHFSDKR